MDDKEHNFGIKRCGPEDIEIVDAIMKHPDIYPNITDDNSVPADQYSAIGVLSNPLCYVLMPNDFSVILLEPINSICYLAHINVLKQGRGIQAVKAALKTMAYVFEKTNCLKIIAWIPVKYLNVIRFTKIIGFSHEGIIKDSYLKNDKLYDQIIFGLSKQEYLKWAKQLEA